MMKIVSYNVRGLGGVAKKKEVSQLIRKNKLDLVCIQETKLEVVEKSLCEKLWDTNEFDFTFKTSNGRSGGLLMIWNTKLFSKQVELIEDHFIYLEGLWGQEGIPLSIVNVYAPCEASRKRVLWRKLA
jgi:exonuclease III